MSIEVMKQALEALERCAMTINWEWGDCRELEEMRQTGQYTDETTPAITALRQAIEQAEPEREGTVMADYEFKTYKTGGAELEAGFYSTDELRDLVKLLDKMNAVTERSIRSMK